jgi:hypothetical protein
MLRRMRSTVLSRLAISGGLLVLATAAVLAIVSMRGNGLAGNAVRPQYRAYYVGVASYQPLPAHPTSADLRRRSVTIPQDLVRSRRYLVAAVGVTGAAATALGLLVRRRPADAGGEGGELSAT